MYKTKFILCSVLIFLLNINAFYAQESKKNPEGLGIEIGAGYNTMNVTYKNNNADSVVAYKRFLLTPCLRLHYDLRLKNFGKSNSIKLKSFISYYTFGGKLKKSDIGEYDIISLASAELGAGLSFDFFNKLQISPLLKGQYIVSATERYIRETSVPPTDRKKEFKSLAYNAGVQLRFAYKHLTIAAEGWLGLSDLYVSDTKNATESNFRLLFGYEF